MKQYVCGICGYIHDEAVDDPTMELHPAQNGKTFPRILSALCAAEDEINSLVENPSIL